MTAHVKEVREAGSKQGQGKARSVADYVSCPSALRRLQTEAANSTGALSCIPLRKRRPRESGCA